MSPRKTPAQTGDSGQAEHVLDENSRARAFWGPRRGAPRRYKCPTHMRIPCNPVGLAPVGIYGLYNDAAPFIATRHATSRQTPHRHRSRQWYCHGGMVCARGGDGRGNLRENREDPAPTVGRLRGWHCDPHRAQRPPIAASIRVLCRPASPHEPVVFTTTQHAASLRSSNNCTCLIEAFIISRREGTSTKGGCASPL